LKIEHPYKDEENLPDSTKGDCTNCPKGYLSVDLKESFNATIYAKTFSFEVIICDRCDYVKLLKAKKILNVRTLKKEENNE